MTPKPVPELTDKELWLERIAIETELLDKGIPEGENERLMDIHDEANRRDPNFFDNEPDHD